MLGLGTTLFSVSPQGPGCPFPTRRTLQSSWYLLLFRPRSERILAHSLRKTTTILEWGLGLWGRWNLPRT